MSHREDSEELPMFPLGLVALPGGVVPLRLFEQRYLQLHEDLLAGPGEFGMVLIERGLAEAKGGEYFTIGSVMQLAGYEEQDDGTVVVVAVATQRLRVLEWLDDDPYPRAIIERLPDARESDQGREVVEECVAQLSRIRALASELGADVGTEEPWFADTDAATMYDIARIAPIQDLDRQRVLEADALTDAAAILESGLLGVVQDLQALLQEG